jgi:hypothetical protein
MAIKIRRGTNAQRVPVVFELAEIAFTTDTKKFYIGDGITAGGILIDDQSLTYNSATNTITTADGHTVVISNIPTVGDIANGRCNKDIKFKSKRWGCCTCIVYRYLRIHTRFSFSILGNHT